MQKTIAGLFDTLAEAQTAVQGLIASGWSRESISVLTSKAGSVSVPADRSSVASPAIQDTEKGALIGGLAGLLIGVSEIAVPGVGLLLIGGWLATTLLGAGLGAIAGGLVGSLVEIGLSHEQAGHLSEWIQKGGTVLTVQTDEDRIPQVVDILKARHAVSIQEMAIQAS